MKPFVPLQILSVDSATAERASSLVDGATAPLEIQTVDWSSLFTNWTQAITNFGIRVVLAITIFFIGRLLIGYTTSLVRRLLERKRVEGVAITLFNSLFVALLYIILGVCVAAMLGVRSVSFAAILASMGLAVGMALSGQLQNLAGGVIIMLTKPFKIGDAIEANLHSGIVRNVSLFHTQVSTFDNKQIYIPNGVLSSGVIINYSEANTRRAEWTISIDYASDYDKAISLIESLLSADDRVLRTPAPTVTIQQLGASSVDLLVRAWVASDELWEVYWAMNKRILETFNTAGIQFPFPQLTISRR